MIFLSILTKTFALALVHLHPLLAGALWIAGAAADLFVARKAEGGARMLGRVLLLQVAALAIGWATADACDYAAMRWKEGIPVFAEIVSGVLGLTGMSVGSHGGQIYLTTMAGPLEFTASIDGMALKIPVLFLAISAVWLLWSEIRVREVLRKFGIIAGILLVAALLRMAFVVLLANGLFDFVGYESEELPYRPFMDEAAGAWLHLPFLLAAGAIIARSLPVPAWGERLRTPLPPVLCWGGGAVMLVLAFVVCWHPAGSPKQGKLIISTYHSRWSRTDRPYDREWYGAESGYNYACLKRLFGVFQPVAEAPGPLTAADLEGAASLLIYDPDIRFTKEELDTVHEFVRGGGGLLVIGDHTNVFGSASHLNELCDPFGFQFRDDVLFDLDADFHHVIDPPWLGSGLWQGLSFFKLRGPTSLRPTSLWTRSVYEVGHSKSVRAIYSVNNFYPPPHDHPKMKSGTFCVSATSHYGRGRVVAWGDSTLFSNFEIFYPGKYEYLLNAMHWLNHRNAALPGVLRRIGLLALLAGVALFLLQHREPRIWLMTTLLLVVSLGAARVVSGFAESRRAEFSKPILPSKWVFFAAHPEDKAHHLRDFITEEPYDQRYEVFIQWVLRTGAFSGFHLPGGSEDNALQTHMRSSNAETAIALIVRKPDDLKQLDQLAASGPVENNPLLLMFASSISSDQAVERIRQSGLVKDAASLARVAGAWPTGEVVIDEKERRVVVVAGAERFSDQSMGISEKVTPDAAQRAQFDRAFGIIDRLFERQSEEPK